eukprot:2122914-Pyramimonas_sp.AAC.1
MHRYSQNQSGQRKYGGCDAGRSRRPPRQNAYGSGARCVDASPNLGLLSNYCLLLACFAYPASHPQAHQC